MLDLEADIKGILYEYVKAASFTSTRAEKEAEQFFIEYFADKLYFKEHPQYVGAYSIPEDPYSRSVCYAMVKGNATETVVLLHHSDIVPIEDFKRLKPYAFSPDELYQKLCEHASEFDEDTKEDLVSGAWLFGRGVCDMKGGGAIQMALLNQYSQLEDFNGNILVIAVPDEENLSAGMRAAVLLLDELKEKYHLDYKLMINSEPHQRKEKETGIFSFGSIGKLMPFIYVRGSLAHAGKVFEGFNPVHVMSSIVKKTEMNMAFSDVVDTEVAPPPTWLYLKDSKSTYDVSMPLTMKGCFSVLTLKRTPQMVIEQVNQICREAFDEVICDMNHNYKKFQEQMGQEVERLPWVTKVVDYQALYEEAKQRYGVTFELAYQEKIRRLNTEFHESKITLIEMNFILIDFIYDYISDLSPRIIYGLIPPYYPSVANTLMKDLPQEIEGLAEHLQGYVREQYGQVYKNEHFYTGISDLSYCHVERSEKIRETLQQTMPLFQKGYDLPLELIERNAMPCMNIGPWGKDFHKLTERVYKEDLYKRTPQILEYAINQVLSVK